MFDNQTLNQLRGVIKLVVKESIREEVPGIVLDVLRGPGRAVIIEIVHGELMSFYEHQIMPQFEDIHKELARIKNVIVTKDYQEERLEKFRVDLGLKYRST